MNIASTAFASGARIPKRHTCDGDNLSPPLAFSGIPVTAKSLALIVADPDAPNGDFVHWLVWNIPPQTAEFSPGVLPKGAIEGNTDFGRPGWGGPCPPSGEHRYYFQLFALDAELDLPSGSAKKDLERALSGHVIEQAVLIGIYSRE